MDGDTLILQGIGRVRLIGVDTPESVDPRRPVEFFAREAADFTRRLCLGRLARVEMDWQSHDRYGRLLAYVWLQDGTFVNREIVRQGFGHALTQYPFKYEREFVAVQAEARSARRGLWAHESPRAP